MAYIVTNFRTKKAVKEALTEGRQIEVYQPGPFGEGIIQDGTVYLEGPHYPKPHKWYAQGMVKDGLLVSVK